MKTKECHDCIERRQLDFIQRVGRIGYWEYEPAERAMSLPEASLGLLASISGRPADGCRSFVEVLSDGECRRFQAALDQAVAGRLALDIELRLTVGNGDAAHLFVRGAPVEADRGRLRFAGTFQDISGEKRTEEQLTRQRDVMKTIIDNFPGAISLCDTDLRMTAYNRQFMELLDFPASLFEKGWVHFEDLARYNADRGEYGPGNPDEQVRAMVERAHNFQAHRIERPRPNGRWLEIRGTPIPSGGFVTSYIDITERKRIEAELVHSKEMAEARREQVASLLDHSGQGFLSFGRDLVVDAECSRACVSMLGRSPVGLDAAEALFADDAAKADLLRAAIPAALDESDPWLSKTMLSLLPGEFRHGERLLKAEYKLLDSGRVMAVLTDVTEERRLENKVETERRRLEMIVAAVADSRDFFDTVEAFREFVSDGLAAILDAPAEPMATVREVYRQVHTFKGLMNQFSFPQTPAALHDLESRLDELRRRHGGLSRRDIAEAVQAVPFKALLDADLAVLRDALGVEFLDSGDRILLSAAQAGQLRRLAERLLRGEPIDTSSAAMRRLLAEIEQLHKLPFKDVLTGFDRLVRQTAARLEKEVAPLAVLGDREVRIDPQVYRPFLRSLTHVFRNAVAHGIEDPGTRLEIGKEECGSITCTVHADGTAIRLSIADDGAGIDVEALRRRAVSAGLLAPDEASAAPDEQILDLIFLDNIGTQQEATELAGRGVGLAAVRGEARNLKGDVAVKTAAGQGTQFLFTLPLQTDMIRRTET